MRHVDKIRRKSSGIAASPVWGIMMIVLLASGSMFSQHFTRITDPNNPIVNESASSPGGYIGSSWVDYDGDGDIDLFVNNNLLYRNEGGGQFTKITDSGLGSGQISGGYGHGQSWADFDNDGDIDCYIAGPNSFLYVNNGDGSFTQVTAGDIGDGFANRGWTAAWADFDNDSFVDLVITHPAGGFVPGGIAIPSLFYHNQSGTLTKVDTFEFTTQLAPYTVPTWADYDLDGDIDLFIGSGPASGTPAVDRLYENGLSQNGSASLNRITEGIIASDLVDGQVWNWIDYDNDRDLDAYLTNYGAATNRLYRNDNGTYVKMTALEVGNIVSESGGSLANIWGDFDNDGDIDCYTTNDVSGPARYYQNDGNGSFTRIDTLVISNQSLWHSGATAGDYDRDGDLDIYATGSPSSRRLYRNEAQDNGNHWINLRCLGTASNKSAIGAIVWAKAQINGATVWQVRHVSAQNSFNCQNSLNVHFGLGNAASIDSLIVQWPSGAEDSYSGVAANGFYIATESSGLVSDPTVGIDPLDATVSEGFQLFENYPNPFNPTTVISYQLSVVSEVQLKVYNLLGQEIRTLVNTRQSPGRYEVQWDGRDQFGREVGSGVYLYRIEAEGFRQARKMILVR